jgi:hypothetical protein
VPVETRSPIEGEKRSFDEEGSGAAEGIEEGKASAVTREKKNSRGYRLLERSLSGSAPVAATVEGLPRQIEADDALVVLEVDAEGSFPARFAQPHDMVMAPEHLVNRLVDDGLDAGLCGEHRVPRANAFDHETIVAGEKALPRWPPGALEESIEIRRVEAGSLEEYPLGCPKLQVGTKETQCIGLEIYPPRRPRLRVETYSLYFVR